MSLRYEELDFQKSVLGGLMLRRRRMQMFGDLDIYEIKLGDDFLMTSLFHEAESQLAYLALKLHAGEKLDVLVGGLGLGYTAAAALEDSRVNSLTVIEYLEPVISWHKNTIVPLGKELCSDSRCKLLHGDFFALSKDETGFDSKEPKKQFDVILLDIDHTPDNVLHQSNTRFYTEEGLRECSVHLKSDGVFAMWADGKPNEDFRKLLDLAFTDAKSHTIEFDNPINQATSFGTVYTARK